MVSRCFLESFVLKPCAQKAQTLFSDDDGWCLLCSVSARSSKSKVRWYYNHSYEC